MEKKLNSKQIKLRIIAAGEKAVNELIKVAGEKIIKHDPEDDLSADRLKNAAATKKLAVFDAFEILNRIQTETENMKLAEKGILKTDTKQGFAERNSK
tara:strand:+ start:444 stop:737 length:294 start_codon:yes stop_codon:yes gene_type:complete